MNHEDEIKQPLYTPQQILDNVLFTSKNNLIEYEREEIILRGKIETLKATIDNIEYMVSRIK